MNVNYRQWWPWTSPPECLWVRGRRLRVSHWPLTARGSGVIERPWTSPPECLSGLGPTWSDHYRVLWTSTLLDKEGAVAWLLTAPSNDPSSRGRWSSLVCEALGAGFKLWFWDVRWNWLWPSPVYQDCSGLALASSCYPLWPQGVILPCCKQVLVFAPRGERLVKDDEIDEWW